MFSAAKLHAMYQLANCAVRRYPFPHICVHDVFPADFFAEIQRNLPRNEHYKALVETGRVGGGYSKARLSLFPEDLAERGMPGSQVEFWRSLFETFGDREFTTVMYNKFEGEIRTQVKRLVGPNGEAKLKSEIFLMRDLETYSLGPHTDSPRKLLSALFYLPTDRAHPELGTSLYVPKDRDFTCEGGPHHDFAKFDLVQTLPYAPNTLVAFPKTLNCFHGVEPVKAESGKRDLILFDIKFRG